MKKIFTLLTILLVSQNINSQQSEFVVEYCLDSSTFQPKTGLICSNETKTKWFAMVPTYLTSTINPIPNGFSVIKLNIGKSSKTDKLIIRFSGRKTVMLKAYNIIDEYGGITNFYASVSDIYVLKNYPLTSIKYVNGLDGTSFTYQLKDAEESFFINAFTNFVVKDIKCINGK
jgi:hypothetical protein